MRLYVHFQLGFATFRLRESSTTDDVVRALRDKDGAALKACLCDDDDGPEDLTIVDAYFELVVDECCRHAIETMPFDGNLFVFSDDYKVCYISHDGEFTSRYWK